MKSNNSRIVTLFGGLALTVIFMFIYIASAFISYFGIHTYYGDIKTSYVKGIKDLSVVEGVEVTFIPKTTSKITDDALYNAKSVIESRLVSNKVSNYEIEITPDNNIWVCFPNSADYDPRNVVQILKRSSTLYFCAGTDNTNVILKGPQYIKSATSGIEPGTGHPMVIVEFTEIGSKKFAEATKDYLGQTISVWLDNTMITAPTVDAVITNGTATITGVSTIEEAAELANEINSGSFPFELYSDENTVKDTLIKTPIKSYLPSIAVFVCSIIFAIACFVGMIVIVIKISTVLHNAKS